jgi:hypothetical protein
MRLPSKLSISREDKWDCIVALVVKRPAALLRCQHRSFVALSGYKYYEMDEAPVCWLQDKFLQGAGNDCKQSTLETVLFGCQ